MTTYCISGSREINDIYWVNEQLHRFLWPEDTVLVGDARGVDALVSVYCRNYIEDVRMFPADWQTHGKAAGPIRNEEMVKQADIVIALWDGESRGTRDAINRALSHGKELHVFIYKGES